MTQPITRNQTLCVAVETTYGSAPAALTANPGHYAQLVHDLRLTPTLLRYERPIQTTMDARHFGAIKKIAGCRLTGWLEMRARGDALTNAKMGLLEPWLRGAKLTVGAYAGGWPFTTAAGDGESISCLWDSAGCRFSATGGRGNLRFVFAPGAVVRVELDFVFNWLTIGPDSAIVPEYVLGTPYLDATPGMFQDAALWTIAEAYLQPRAVTIDLRNQVVSVPTCNSTAAPTVTRILSRGPASDQGVAITIEIEAADGSGSDQSINWDNLVDTGISTLFPASPTALAMTDSGANLSYCSIGGVEIVGVSRGASGDLITETVDGRLRASAFGAVDDFAFHMDQP